MERKITVWYSDLKNFPGLAARLSNLQGLFKIVYHKNFMNVYGQEYLLKVLYQG